MKGNYLRYLCLTSSSDGSYAVLRRMLAGAGTRLALVSAVSALLMPCALHAAPFAYVPNEKSGTISIIDCANDNVVGQIKAGTKPRGLAVSRDGNTLYVSDQPANALLIVDLKKRETIDMVPLGESPEGVEISQAGDWVVAVGEITNSVSFISTATNKKVFTVKTEGKNPSRT